MDYKMQDIPPPIEYHFGRNGFKHATSSNMYDWVSNRKNMVESRVERLKEMDCYQDTVAPSQKSWLRSQNTIRGVKLHTPTDEFLQDYGEGEVLRRRLGGA